MKINNDVYTIVEALGIDVKSLLKIRTNALVNMTEIEEIILPQPEIKLMGYRCKFGDVKEPTAVKRDAMTPPSPW